MVCKAAKALACKRENGAADRPPRCVFEVAFTFGDAGKNAHKRLLEKPLSENAGAIGEIRLVREARDVWLAHLKRNRHYEDKYGDSTTPERRREWWDENVKARRARHAAPSPRTQTWESSYVVTPNPEWFR